MMIPIKGYDNTIIKKLKMLILNMVLNFMVVCNPKKLQMCSPNYPCIHALTLNMI